jgi:aminopeptidase Y
MSLTPPTTGKEPVYGDLVLVENEGCAASDYPAEVSGNIALVMRGACAFGIKSELAGKAGAVAAVVFNSNSDGLSGTLGAPSPFHVATFGLSGKDAKPVIERLKAGKAVDSIAFIDSVVNTINTTNIIIQTVQGDPDNCVMLGAHSDSVGEGPGINGMYRNITFPVSWSLHLRQAAIFRVSYLELAGLARAESRNGNLKDPANMVFARR